MGVGDYVRTINGIIAKIESKRDYTTGDYIGGENDFFLNVNHSYQDYDRIVKSSSNIIDLIEVGDYVNDDRVIDIEKYPDGTIELNFYISQGGYYQIYEDKDIKSIVTKECFESMEYKVGE